MSDDSPAYDASLAAALAIHDELFPKRKPNARTIDKITFIIMAALEAIDFWQQAQPSRNPSAN
jgi:hypothetical protein